MSWLTSTRCAHFSKPERPQSAAAARRQFRALAAN
jgi:hypothetical protein